MRTRTRTPLSTRPVFLLTTLALAVSLATPATASADALKLWVAGRGNYFSGQSDLFKEFKEPFGGGLEAGLEFFGITFFTEAMSMIPQTGALPDQWLFTGNLGIDFTFGKTVRFHVGAYTGPMLFLFPEAMTEGGVDFDKLSDETKTALVATGQFDSVQAAEDDFNAKFASAEEDLSKLAFGWNLGRLRMALDVKFAKVIAIGIAGQVGYHYLISGEQAAAGAKNQAIDEFGSQNNLPPNLIDELRMVAGAEPIDTDSLNGLNYDASLYLRFEFTTAN